LCRLSNNKDKMPTYGKRKASRKFSRKGVKRFKGSRKGIYGLRRSVKALWRNAVEKRLKDFQIVGSIPNTWSQTSIVSIPLEGAAPNQGDGFRPDTNIVATSLTVMGNIKYKVNDVDQNLPAGIRFVVMMDTQYTQAGAAVAADPWQDNRFDSLISLTTRGRYSILFDRTYINTDDVDLSLVRFKVPLNKKVRYSGDFVVKNIIYLMVCGISSEVAGQFIDVKARLHYTC